MKTESLASLCNILNTPINDPQKFFTGVSVDSRSINQGELFFALKGEHVDGHTYLPEVSAKGATGAVVSKTYKGPHYGMTLLFVEDPLSSLQLYAKNILDKRKTQIIGITGSLGKTTTKDFLTALLKEKYHVASSPGNSNSQIGLPLSILNHYQGDEEILILEMGMTHPGNIANLVSIAPPKIAVITEVSLVHACNFDSIEGISLAKGEIFSHPSTEIGLLPAKLPFSNSIQTIGHCKKKTFGIDEIFADFSMSSKGEQLVVRDDKHKSIISTWNIPGVHNRHNLLAAIAVARLMDLSFEEINLAIPKLVLPERRLQTVEKNGIIFINDAYNASEQSVKAALNSIPDPKQGGRKIAVLGSMMELGKFSEQCHLAIGETALQKVDYLFCLGEECKPMVELWKKAKRSVEWFYDRYELVKILRAFLRPNDIVLLKGSRSKALWMVINEL